MGSSLARPRSKQKSTARRRRKQIHPEVMDAVTMASTLQLQEQRREINFSLLALTMKLGLVSLCVVTLVKLSIAYQERLDRHGELVAVLNLESAQLNTLQQRFDRLFTLGGGIRLMDEHDQWIAPNRLRVIWR
ncbi:MULTISPECIES: hypothetical protein [Prochlorococcus]|uniref:hypothetical protein n=1 Tax=Prochlorococcus TaxID=1218 RepID=UPI000B1BDAD5|nr:MULTISPECIES: hypothetical protein [Prochlorococcus]NMO83725.1 hypothetical protein [Prochlorococcus sp. P1344]NMP05527.1 hypothetical protein [Prochlorococcus sp. P1361]NMP14494.1 hypothetical protein [Prochlorococcus sp.P1363]